MDVCVLFSGGKDSTYAAYLAKKKGHDVKCLLSFNPKNVESYMFHSANIRLTELQAKRMGIGQVLVETEGEKEKELDDIREALRGLIREPQPNYGVVTGAQASQYQKSRIDAICKELGLKSLAPLWGKDPAQMLRDELALGFNTIITSISADGLDESWLGRKIDEQCIAELEKLNKKNKVHIGGEGGEYCTTVLNCPLFSREIKILKSEKVLLGQNRGYFKITGAI